MLAIVSDKNVLTGRWPTIVQCCMLSVRKQDASTLFWDGAAPTFEMRATTMCASCQPMRRAGVDQLRDIRSRSCARPPPEGHYERS